MEWFKERYNGSGLEIKVLRKIAEARSIQHIEVYETVSFGKMLVIDGKIQLTELDEVFYHEMIAHVPMMMHENPRRVLVIGGGDGGTLREVLKHEVDEVVLVEIDRAVIDLSREHLKIDQGAFEDDRVKIVIEDGLKYVERCEDHFDVVIVDSTDPVGVSDPLFDEKFFKNASNICDIICCQAQSPIIQKHLFIKLWKNVKAFGKRRVYLSYIPTYPLGYWAFIVAGKVDKFFEERFGKLKGKVKHYNPELHRAAFALPEWLKREIDVSG